jgi:hypothetical protein
VPHLDEADMACREIRQALAFAGYFHALGPRPLEWFEAACAALGAVKMRTDIVFDPVREAEQKRTRTFGPHRPGVYTDGELDFHTDNPTWSVLGWYCVEQDEHSGDSLLLDLGDVDRDFTAEELRELGEIQIYLPVRDAAWNETAVRVPLLSRQGRAWQTYWVPWLVVEESQTTHAEMLDRFRQWLRRKESTQLIDLRLQPGESLFIHNNRMLHGRRPLTPRSRRHLIRLAVSAEALE